MDNNPQFIYSFIELYRQQPCLWKIKDETYSNKPMKDEAYAKLLDLYREAIPTATVDMVKKKINNLRCAFRKELKKVKMSRSNSSGEVYTPHLWYYDLLQFTLDQRRTGSISEDETLIVLSESEEESKPPRSSEILMSSEGSSPERKRKIRSIGRRPDVNIDEFPRIPREHEVDNMKIKEAPEDVINEANMALKNDEFDGIGINVACKLRRMDGEQRLYAELIINKVLIHGMKGRLQEETDITGLFIR